MYVSIYNDVLNVSLCACMSSCLLSLFVFDVGWGVAVACMFIHIYMCVRVVRV